MNISGFVFSLVIIETLLAPSYGKGEDCKLPVEILMYISRAKYFYNHEIGKCIIPLGAECNTILQNLQDLEVPWTCPQNSYCMDEGLELGLDVRGVCTCSLLYNPSTDSRSCTEGKLAGEKCGEADGKCVDQAGLLCREGICACAEEGYSWSNTTSNCIHQECSERGASGGIFKDSNRVCRRILLDPTLLRTFLQNDVHCPDRAHLEEYETRDIINDNFNNQAANSNTGVECVCDKGFHESKDRKNCLPDIQRGEECDPDISHLCRRDQPLICTKINDKFSCECSTTAVWNVIDSTCYSDLTCQAKFGMDSFYDSLQAKCFKYAHGKCYKNDPFWPACPPHSTCRSQPRFRNEDINKIVPRCICEDGYMPDDDERICKRKKQYGEECFPDHWDVFNCDWDSRLSCKRETKVCACQDGQAWNARSKMCETPVGESCLARLGDEDCGKNMECIWNDKQRSYQCSCKSGFSTSEDNFCLGKYSTACQIDRDCQLGMSCIDNNCKCSQPIAQRYDETLDKCLNLVGSICNQGGESNATSEECPENASCLEGVCKCNPGFWRIPNGECAFTNLKGLNETCSADGNCDFVNGLTCIQGKCECIDPTLEFKDGRGCMGPVGSRCGWFELGGTCLNSEGTKGTCKLYHVNCDESARCTYITKEWSQCEIDTAPMSSGRK